MAYDQTYHRLRRAVTREDEMRFLVDGDEGSSGDHDVTFYADDPTTGTLMLRIRKVTGAPAVEVISGAGSSSLGTSGAPWSEAHATIVRAGDGSVSSTGLGFENDADTGLIRSTTNTLQIVTGGVARWQVGGSGNLVAVLDNTYDLGLSGTSRPRDLYLGGGLNAGGTTNPGVGDGIFLAGVVVGFDGAPVADQVQIGDANFALSGAGTDPQVTWDAGSDRLQFVRASDELRAQIAGTSRLILGASGAVIPDGLLVGFSGTPTADAALVGDANFGLDFNGGTGRLNFDGGDGWEYDRAGNTLTFRTGSTARVTLAAAAASILGDGANPGTLTLGRASSGNEGGQLTIQTVITGVAGPDLALDATSRNLRFFRNDSDATSGTLFLGRQLGAGAGWNVELFDGAVGYGGATRALGWGAGAAPTSTPSGGTVLFCDGEGLTAVTPNGVTSALMPNTSQPATPVGPIRWAKAVKVGVVQTTDATATQLITFTLPDECVALLLADVVTQRSGSAETNAYRRAVKAERQSGGAATIGTVQTTYTLEDNAGLTLIFTASGNDVRVTATGVAGQTWDWLGYMSVLLYQP